VTRLTVTIIAWNEEERLRACLESVAWADEIVVIDAESTDKTAALAREFTDRVWVRPWPGFEVQKNFAI
jgi:glycosyltransferase involved in cell wall biosynthesis